MEKDKKFEQLEQEHEEFQAKLKRDEEWWKNEKAEDKKRSKQNILEHIKELEEELSRADVEFSKYLSNVISAYESSDSEYDLLRNGANRSEFKDKAELIWTLNQEEAEFIAHSKGHLEWLREDLEKLNNPSETKR